MRAPSLRTVLVIEIALAFVLSACRGATPAPAEETGGERGEAGGNGDATGASTNDGSHDVVAEAAARCPERYGTAPPSCDAADDPGTCAYPEGTCGCRVPEWCGGAAPPPMPPTWICEDVGPGCPAAGTPCTGTGTCASGPCGRHQVVCANGVWTPAVVPYPPASAPRD